jgi:hypothetical protein
MVNVLFFLKFKAQLKRTRPDLVRQLDETLIRAIGDAGGKITSDRSVISAVFNEETIGFWLDMYILIENVKKTLDSSPEFFGFSLVINSNMHDSPEPLCRFLSCSNGGVFFDARATKKFVPYAFFEKPSDWLKDRKIKKYGSAGFFRIKELKVFKSAGKSDLDLQKDVADILKQNQKKNVLVLGPVYSQMRGGLQEHCNKLNGDFPPLTFCFGSIGLGAIVDAWSQSIRSISAVEAKASAEEIDSLWELLFRERIRDEVSEFIVRSVKKFLSQLFRFYFNSAYRKKKTPIIALENLQLAGKKITDLLLDSIREIKEEDRERLLIIGLGEEDIPAEKQEAWESVFDEVIKIESVKPKSMSLPKLPSELWEIVFAISLFSRYFSPELFQRLFEENEKNPAMITRAFSILQTLGVIDNTREPRTMNRYFEEHARKILGDRTLRVKEMVRGRLLSWADRRNINPCFRLLTIIASLDGLHQIDDLLLLKAVSSDIVNETISALETAIKSGQLDELVSAQRAAAVRYIFNTSRALYIGNEQDIDKVFLEPHEDFKISNFESLSVLKAQIIVNLSGYYLGRHDKPQAAEKAKEAILLGQSKNTFCLSQGYRLFALVCLSKQQTSETIDYLNFALANAEKTGNYHELGISAYYAAAAQFLYGDVYNAQRLAKKSIEHSLAAGHPDWADRSRFLEGRLEFELGRYSQAHDIFSALKKEPYAGMNDEKDSLLSAWIYRMKIYFESPETPKPQHANYDADLFEIEAAYLAGDYKKAAELSSVMTNPFSQEGFLYTEQPDWRSGFAQCEHLYFTQGEIQDRMICLFNSLALSRLSPEDGEEAMKNLQRILRYEQLCEMDPWDAFYYYAKYCILEHTGASLVDMSTAVSMAFKRLQRRASRIEEIETRRQYLNGPRWNRELSLTAKEYKLI